MSSLKISIERVCAANRLVPYPDGPWSPATFRGFCKSEDVKELIKKFPELHVEKLPEHKDERAIVVLGVRGVWDCSRDAVVSDQEINDALILPSAEFDRFLARVPHSVLRWFSPSDVPYRGEQQARNANRLRQSQMVCFEEQRVETHHYELLQRAYDWVLERDKLKRYRYAVSLVLGDYSEYAIVNGSNRWTTRIVSLNNSKRAFQTYVALCCPIVIPLLVMVRSPLAPVKTFLRRDGDHAIVTRIAQFFHAPVEQKDETE